MLNCLKFFSTAGGNGRLKKEYDDSGRKTVDKTGVLLRKKQVSVPLVHGIHAG